MNYQFVRHIAICITLLYLSPAMASELQLEATGSGTLTTDTGSSFPATVESWDDGQTSLIEITFDEISDQFLQIVITSYSPDGRSATGHLTGWEGKNRPCLLYVNDSQTELSGTCITRDKADNSRLQFSFPKITKF